MSIEAVRLNPEIAGMSPLEIAEAGIEKCLGLAQEILGSDHEGLGYLRRESGGLGHYVEVTGYLLDDTIARWGGRLGIDSSRREQVLCNIAAYDMMRFERLVTLEYIGSGILTGEWNEDEALDLPYRLINQGEAPGTYPISRGFAVTELGYRPADGVIYDAYKDERVPFLYLHAGPIEEDLAAGARDVIADLYRGKPLNMSRSARKQYPETGLSKEARDELAMLGCLILHPEASHHVTSSLSSSDQPGMFLSPVRNLPWTTRRGKPTQDFLDVTLSQWEHETQHLKDFRAYADSMVSCCLLEARALCKELDYHNPSATSPHILRWIAGLLPLYANTLNGGDRETPHSDIRYIERLGEICKELPPEKAKQTDLIRQELYRYVKKYNISL